MSQSLLSGNEAVAQGAWEAGVAVGVGYPGTPSTETLEYFAKLPGVYAEWAPNEKVALEVAAGVSLAGQRSLVAMKHVGLNVAADPFFTLTYTGVGGGLVLLVADDPGFHSSQNEQDTRNYAAFARALMVEPSDSREALDFTKQAYDLSERFDLPVIVRSTVRIAHAKSMVETGQRMPAPEPPVYESDPAKWVMMPAMARVRRGDLERRMAEATEFAETTLLNRAEYRDTSVGVVCSGVSYQHVREALPDASVLKIGMSNPLPPRLIAEFASNVDRLVVVEEADAYLKRSIRSMGVTVDDLDLPVSGELSPGAVRAAFHLETPPTRTPVADLPPRPPLMCPGCPHRPVFDALRKARAIVTGDIGCYTLGALRPLSSIDSCVDMGASIGMAHGIDLVGVNTDRERPVVAVIGDSTFAHSGITGLLNTVYNSGSGTVLILDNRITAMTGHQGNPINGITLQDRPTSETDLPRLVKALGVNRVRVEDPHDLAAVATAIAEETASRELSVIIFRAPCALLIKDRDTIYAVDDEACTKCNRCVKLGCPAIGRDPDTKIAYIDGSVCVGCGDCVQVCRDDAILHSGPACDVGGV